ncbi:MAG: ATP-binding protein [Bacteroidales bacterium]|jgi:nitrogen fixation/metabolism regulation signal transduction histidine kinase|nr:ATP-binding protein [Bacteroidales bacterium]
MVFSRFKISILIQVVLIALTAAAFFWSVQKEYMLVTSSSMVLLWIAQIAFLIWYVQKLTRDIQKLISSLKYNDLSIGFEKEKRADPSFYKIYTDIHEIIHNISKVRIEKETEHQYFQNTIKHLGIGILGFTDEGKIEICNKAALELLNRPHIMTIDDLEKTRTGLAATCKNIRPGATRLVKVSINNETLQLSFKAANFKIKEKNIQLLSIQNIKTEIDQSEVEAWQKLIRVLTHEIMNSVSPIKLLSGSLVKMFYQGNQIKSADELDKTTLENAVLGLKTIRKRSAGLSDFVETYKSLTQIPKPKFSTILVSESLKHIQTLFEDEFKQKEIDFIVSIYPYDLILMADEKLIEQVLINLIKNAIEVLENIKKPKITIEASQVNGSVELKIKDNGAGIPAEMMDQIFIPFFTSKEKGSGIGLSLSRQIMHLHGGTVSVKSIPGVETVFTLQFN